MIFCIQLCWMQGGFAQEEDLYVRVSKENLRDQPNGNKVGELMSGTKLKVLEKQDRWVKVQLTGWIWQPSTTPDPTQVVNFKVRASHILVETQEEAEQLLSQLMQGADFAELAKQHSRDRASGDKGGDLGMFGKGDLRPEFEDAVFRLKVGSMSGIVKTDLGYHIIKRTG